MLIAALAAPQETRTVTGSVLDDRRAPVAGARVVARTQAPVAMLEAVSGSDGRFEFGFPASPEGNRWLTSIVTVTATTSDGRIGHELASFGAEEWQEGRELELRSPILLEAGGALSVDVRDAKGPIPGANVELQAHYLWAAEAAAITDERGRARIEPAPPGDFTLYVMNEGCGRRTQEVRIESGATTSAAVEVLPMRSLAILVTDDDTGEPIPGARVVVERKNQGDNPGPFPRLRRTEFEPRGLERTDERGRLDWTGLEAGSVLRVEAEADHYYFARPSPIAGEDGHTQTTPGSLVVTAEARQVHLALKRLARRVMRWRIVEGEGDAPADGTPVSITLSVVEGWGSRQPGPEPGVVRDGFVELTVEMPEYFDPPIEATAGFAETSDGQVARLRPREDGMDARARFVRGAALEVRLVDHEGAPRPRSALAVLLEPPEPESAHESRLRRDVVTDRAGLAQFRALWPGRWALYSGGAARIVDLSRGDVSCELAPPPQAQLVLEFTIAGERRLPRKFDVSIRGECHELRREDPERGDLHLSVVRPAAESEVELSVHFWDGRRILRSIGEFPAAGRLRVPIDVDRDAQRNPTSPQRLAAGLASVSVVWKVPAGENGDFLALEIPGTLCSGANWWRSLDWEWPLAETHAPTQFQFDREDPPVLHILHPYLVGARRNDAIKLANPREAITLHLEVGPHVSLTPQLPAGLPPIRGAFVTLAEADAPPEQSETRPALLRGSDFVFAPPEAGKRRVLLDPVVAAPVELEVVEFDGGPKELGPVRFGSGTTLRIYPRVTPPFATPFVDARAVRLDGLRYERLGKRVRENSPEGIEIRGLGRGRFRVTLNQHDSDRTWSVEVDVDGEHDAEVTIDVD